ncbi:hypothetical protein CR513_26428, partial [Mucuna pruriens]
MYLMEMHWKGCNFEEKRNGFDNGEYNMKISRPPTRFQTNKLYLDFQKENEVVTRITFIIVFSALAYIYKFVIHQMNVKTTFLNGKFDEEVYMTQLEGFVVKRSNDMLIFGIDRDEVESLRILSRNFNMKNLGVDDEIL